MNPNTVLNFAIMITVIALFILGFGLGRAVVVTDCEKLGMFRHDDKVFVCAIKDTK